LGYSEIRRVILFPLSSARVAEHSSTMPAFHWLFRDFLAKRALKKALWKFYCGQV